MANGIPLARYPMGVMFITFRCFVAAVSFGFLRGRQLPNALWFACGVVLVVAASGNQGTLEQFLYNSADGLNSLSLQSLIRESFTGLLLGVVIGGFGYVAELVARWISQQLVCSVEEGNVQYLRNIEPIFVIGFLLVLLSSDGFIVLIRGCTEVGVLSIEANDLTTRNFLQGIYQSLILSALIVVLPFFAASVGTAFVEAMLQRVIPIGSGGLAVGRLLLLLFVLMSSFFAMTLRFRELSTAYSHELSQAAPGQNSLLRSLFHATTP